MSPYERDRRSESWQAVCELAKQYNFKSIGGTSAGAIAASAAAAAEMGHRTGAGSGFAGLAALPDWMGKPGHLFRMFEPQPEARDLLSILMAATGSKSTAGKIAALIGQLLRQFPIAAAVLAAFVVFVAWFVLSGVGGWAYAYSIAAPL